MTVCPHPDKAIGLSGEIRIVPDVHGHITLDYDGIVKPPRRFYLYNPKDQSNVIRCTHWRLSASRKGVHVLVCLKKDLTALEKFLFRMWNRDDIWRLSYDILRYDMEQYVEAHSRIAEMFAEGSLFDLKNGKEAGPWQ